MVIGERQVEDFGQIVDQLRRAVGAICYKDERHLVGTQFLKIKEQTPSELPSDQANQSQRLAYMNGLFWPVKRSSSVQNNAVDVDEHARIALDILLENQTNRKQSAD